MGIPALIPSFIPSGNAVAPASESAPTTSIYDVAIGGIGFVYSNTLDNPAVRETVPTEKDRIDQAETPGEQTLTSWWIKSQDSFHGGAGQLQLEPAEKSDFDHLRYDLSKNVDVFTPGRVSRLPDTTVLTGVSVVKILPVTVAGADALVYLTAAGGVFLVTNLYGSPTTTQFTYAGVPVFDSITTDGTWVFAVGAATGAVIKLNPSNPTFATPQSPGSYSTGTYTGKPLLAYVKARLMLAVNGAVFEVDANATGGPALTTPLYKHPTTGWTWRCFAPSSTSILAAGDALGTSTVTQFSLESAAGAPVLTVQGEVCALPRGERVLSMAQSQGTFLVLGTSKGIRVGTYNTYNGALTYGPLELLRTDPQIPCVALADRDSFIYAAGLAYDEGGLMRIDLGTQIDQAGRYAWAPDLICPTATLTAANDVCTLGVTGRLVFSVPGTGILLEGVGAGVGRESWIRTSRIRFGTTEPKLFKVGRNRGYFPTGEIRVSVSTPTATTGVWTQVGFTTVDPPEYRLPEGTAEWMALTFTLTGASTTLSNWAVKALPATRKQRRIKLVLALADAETTKSGQRAKDTLGSRDRLTRLEELDSTGDETVLQEYTPVGVVSTRVVVERVTFTQTGRPSRRSDIGGVVTVVLRTVEN